MNSKAVFLSDLEKLNNIYRQKAVCTLPVDNFKDHEEFKVGNYLSSWNKLLWARWARVLL